MRILRRGEWGFSGPLGPPMSTPSNQVFIHHSVTNPTSDARADMRTLERIGKQRFGRLSYSFAVHPSGAVLQGQGNHVGAHTKNRNSTSHGLVAIGNYDTRRPPAVMVEAFRNLYRHGISEGWWKDSIAGHRDVSSTACPGKHLYARLSDIREPQEDDMAVSDWARPAWNKVKNMFPGVASNPKQELTTERLVVLFEREGLWDALQHSKDLKGQMENEGSSPAYVRETIRHLRG